MEPITNKSEFNEASLKMKRLHEIQYSINVSMINHDFQATYDLLGTLFREIYSKLNPTEREECFKEIGILGKKVANAKSMQQNMGLGVRIENGSPSFGDLPSRLFMLDCKLREYLDKYGFSDKGSEEGMF